MGSGSHNNIDGENDAVKMMKIVESKVVKMMTVEIVQSVQK